MRFRKLRIAWSVLWGLACLLLIALWVRSYTWFDIVYYQPGAATMFEATSEEGVIRFQDCSGIIGAMDIGWKLDRTWSGGYPPSEVAKGPILKKIFRWFERQNRSSWGDTLLVPHWFFVASVAMLFAVPWLHLSPHFSLRTLLIATTLVAVLLGLIVYTTRQ